MPHISKYAAKMAKMQTESGIPPPGKKKAHSQPPDKELQNAFNRFKADWDNRPIKLSGEPTTR